jgi:cytidine deaminase
MLPADGDTCGACSQMLAGFAPDIEIYLASDAGIKKYSVQELLPYPYIGKAIFLNKKL